eukprot:2126113-Amphidinium_carterae.1
MAACWNQTAPLRVLARSACPGHLRVGACLSILTARVFEILPSDVWLAGVQQPNNVCKGKNPSAIRSYSEVSAPEHAANDADESRRSQASAHGLIR